MEQFRLSELKIMLFAMLKRNRNPALGNYGRPSHDPRAFRINALSFGIRGKTRELLNKPRR